MRTRRTPPLPLPRLLLVAVVLAAGLLPGPDAQAGASPRVPGPGREILAGVAPRPVPGPGQKIRARYAILVDPATGAVLWSRRSRMPAPPASLTKMLTGLAVRASLDMDAMTVASRASARQARRARAQRHRPRPPAHTRVGRAAGPRAGHEARPAAHRQPGPEGPDDRVRQRRGGDAGRGGRRVG